MKRDFKLWCMSLLMVFSGAAQAGCWVEWRGIHSEIVCDEAGVRPTFKNLENNLREIAGLSSSCKSSILKTAGSYYECALAKSLSTEVAVGAGEACKEFSGNLRQGQEACAERVNIRSAPSTTESVVFAHSSGSFTRMANGMWYEINGEGKLLTFREVARNPQYIELYDSTRPLSLRIQGNQIYFFANGSWHLLYNRRFEPPSDTVSRVWSYPRGSFNFKGNRQWVEVTSNSLIGFEEIYRNKNEVHLYDRSRNLTVALKGHYSWFKVGNSAWSNLYLGGFR